MHIGIASGIADEVKVAARRGKLPSFIVCGVDVYLHPEYARREGAKTSRRSVYQNPGRFHWESPTLYYQSTHFFEILNLKTGEASPCSDISELRAQWSRIRKQEFFTLAEDIPVSVDEERAYVLTPLTREELSDFLLH